MNAAPDISRSVGPFPFTGLGTPEHVAPLPADADLVVIGGGVAGVTTALFAARAGLRVVLCEKGRLAGEQSGRNWGWIRQQGRDPGELSLMIEANRLWQELAQDSGEEFGLSRVGVTYLAKTEKDMDRYAKWLPHAQSHDLDSRMMDRSEIKAAFPSGTWIGGLTTPSDMKAEPWLAVPALGRLAAREGVTIREACAVRGLDISAGRVTGVVTEAGTIACSSVAVCAGAWSRLFLRRHGVKIPQLAVRSSVAATQPLPNLYPGAAADDRLAFRPRSDGGYSIAPAGFHELMVGPDAFASFTSFIREYLKDPSNTRLLPAAPRGYPDAWATPRRWAFDRESPFEAMRVLNPAPNKAKLEQTRATFAKLFPEAGPVRLAASWAGMIDVMPDVVPVIDAVPLEGAYVATGLSGHGFGIGPAVGRALVDMITGAPARHDLTRFRYGRFDDGTKLVPGPSL